MRANVSGTITNLKSGMGVVGQTWVNLKKGMAVIGGVWTKIWEKITQYKVNYIGDMIMYKYYQYDSSYYLYMQQRNADGTLNSTKTRIHSYANELCKSGEYSYYDSYNNFIIYKWDSATPGWPTSTPYAKYTTFREDLYNYITTTALGDKSTLDYYGYPSMCVSGNLDKIIVWLGMEEDMAWYGDFYNACHVVGLYDVKDGAITLNHCFTVCDFFTTKVSYNTHSMEMKADDGLTVLICIAEGTRTGSSSGTYYCYERWVMLLQPDGTYLKVKEDSTTYDPDDSLWIMENNSCVTPDGKYLFLGNFSNPSQYNRADCYLYYNDGSTLNFLTRLSSTQPDVFTSFYNPETEVFWFLYYKNGSTAYYKYYQLSPTGSTYLGETKVGAGGIDWATDGKYAIVWGTHSDETGDNKNYAAYSLVSRDANGLPTAVTEQSKLCTYQYSYDGSYTRFIEGTSKTKL